MNPDQEARTSASVVVSRLYHEEPNPCPVCVQQARHIIDTYLKALPPDVLAGKDGLVRVEPLRDEEGNFHPWTFTKEALEPDLHRERVVVLTPLDEGEH